MFQKYNIDDYEILNGINNFMRDVLSERDWSHGIEHSQEVAKNSIFIWRNGESDKYSEIKGIAPISGDPLIIIVAAFNIISGLTILIKNKTKEIAILKTLGLSNKSIVKSFFLTGFTIGLTATIAGIILGTLFATYIEPIRIFLSNILHIEIFPADIKRIIGNECKVQFFRFKVGSGNITFVIGNSVSLYN